MAGDPSSRAERRVVRLLAALVALEAVLVLAVAAGAVVIWREYGRVRAAVAPVAGGDGAARQALLDATRRQELAARELAAAAGDAARQIAEFERRAERLRGQEGGPVVAASRAVEMTQLMTDEMLLQLKLMETLVSVLEKAARPLETQRSLVEGGSGAVRRQGRAGPGG